MLAQFSCPISSSGPPLHSHSPHPCFVPGTVPGTLKPLVTLNPHGVFLLHRAALRFIYLVDIMLL